MRKLTILFILFSGFIFSQEFTVTKDDLTYVKVVDVPNKSKSDIYKGLKSFLNNSANNSKYLIDTDNLEIGLISYNEKTDKFPISEFSNLHASYKVSIDIKDNKFRYSINNFKFVVKYAIVNSEYNFTYKTYSDSLEDNKKIEELELKLSQETKEKKRNAILMEIAKEKAGKKLLQDAIDNIKKIIASNPDIYLQEINKSSSDW